MTTMKEPSSEHSILLLKDVQLFDLEMHVDERGVFTEIQRASWTSECEFRQWNVVSSAANVLRGVHVHKTHYDCLTLIKGRALFALKDLRSGSETFKMSSLLEFSGTQLKTLLIPPGVAHGFYFYEESIHIYGVSEYWDDRDELGCYFNDKELAIDWPNSTPILSSRDRDLPPLNKIQSFF